MEKEKLILEYASLATKDVGMQTDIDKKRMQEIIDILRMTDLAIIKEATKYAIARAK